MIIPTEPIGSIPRPLELIDALAAATDPLRCDDTSTSRDRALANIWTSVPGAAMAAQTSGGR